MPVPPIPLPLEHLGQRPFSFYPPIVNIEHNEWLLRKATWSELMVANTRTQEELWIPRQYLGQVSAIDEPVLLVGLTKELEYKAGQVMPHVRRVIEMPRAVNDAFRPQAEAAPPPTPAAVEAIRLSGGAESRVGRLIIAALALGLLACVLVILVFRGTRDGSRTVYRPVLQSDLGFSAQDRYETVVRRLGQPAADRWRSEQGELQYRILDYPVRGFSVVLMGTERDKAVYIGAIDREGHVIDSVRFRGGDTAGLLKSLGGAAPARR